LILELRYLFSLLLCLRLNLFSCLKLKSVVFDLILTTGKLKHPLLQSFDLFFLSGKLYFEVLKNLIFALLFPLELILEGLAIDFSDLILVDDVRNTLVLLDKFRVFFGKRLKDLVPVNHLTPELIPFSL
jgi:hypothetical protein